MAQDIVVREVASGSDLKTFIRLPWKFNAGDPCWAPPLIFDVKRRLSKKHNRFFDHGEAALFMAWRGLEPVGRISAQFDRHYDEHWGPGVGFLGWFECEDDPGTAAALFDAASEWVKKRGRSRIQGPFSFNINDECGLLIDGFDAPPMVMNPHNPRYYPALFEQNSFYKAQDLFAYRMDATAEAPEDVRSYAEAIRSRGDVMVRTWNMKDFKNEMNRWLEVYNSAWEKNWGAIRLTEAEFKAHSIELRWLADSRLAFFAETKDGEVMGAALTLPNFNEYLAPCNGHVYGLLPFKWRDMVVKKKYRSCRVFTLGTKEKFRRSGVGAVFYHDTLMAAKKLGYQWGEMSWILESNDAMNRAIRHMGGELYKTYRIYEREV